MSSHFPQVSVRLILVSQRSRWVNLCLTPCSYKAFRDLHARLTTESNLNKQLTTTQQNLDATIADRDAKVVELTSKTEERSDPDTRGIT
jgi:hypothetical protein